MRRTSSIALAVAALCGALSCATAQTVEQIVSKSVAARGGAERLAALRFVRLFGTMSFGAAPVPDTVEIARPGQIRTTLSFPDGRLVQGYDGTTAWMIDPGKPEARELTGDAARNVAAGADYDGPYIDAQRKGNEVTFDGIDTVDAKPAYRLRVQLKNGLVDEYFIDIASGLQVKWEGTRTESTGRVTYVSYFRDYRPAAGVMWARRIESGTKGKPITQRIVIDSVEVNRGISPERFRMPGRSFKNP